MLVVLKIIIILIMILFLSLIVLVINAIAYLITEIIKGWRK